MKTVPRGKLLAPEALSALLKQLTEEIAARQDAIQAIHKLFLTTHPTRKPRAKRPAPPQPNQNQNL